MPAFTAVRDVAAPASRVWAALVHWPDHGRWAPLTRVRVVTPREDGVGARFVGRTGIGPLGFDDPMEVVAWRPPAGDGPGDAAGRCEVVKQGRVVLGSAWFEVRPLPGGRSRVTWHEDVDVPPVRVTRRLGPVVSVGGRLAFQRVLAAMARQVEGAG